MPRAGTDTMTWQSLLGKPTDTAALPWWGGPSVFGTACRRRWDVVEVPPEHGWWTFRLDGRRAHYVGPAEPEESWFDGAKIHYGYLVGDRFVANHLPRVDVSEFYDVTERAFLVPLGLERFQHVSVASAERGVLFRRIEFPVGSEMDVCNAYVDRRDSLAHVKHVYPALNLAFLFACEQRARHERRHVEREAKRAEAALQRQITEQREEAMRQLGSAVARRIVAQTDFETAARAALAVSGAELLDVRRSYNRSERVVQFRFRQRRFECVCDADTLRIVDAGVCLTDSRTGERGDERFTLESLPPVLSESMDRGALHVYRHLDEDW